MEPIIITTRATRLASREEEAALHKHGREGLLLRGVVGRACAGPGAPLLFAFLLPTIISFPSYQGAIETTKTATGAAIILCPTTHVARRTGLRSRRKGVSQLYSKQIPTEASAMKAAHALFM